MNDLKMKRKLNPWIMWVMSQRIRPQNYTKTCFRRLKRAHKEGDYHEEDVEYWEDKCK